MDLGPGELAIILVIILVLFGGKKLPELARSLGQAKKEFEKGGDGEASAPDAKTAAKPAVKASDEGGIAAGETADARPEPGRATDADPETPAISPAPSAPVASSDRADHPA